MKKLIVLVVLVVAGYFAYQHVYLAQQETAAVEEEESSSVESEYYVADPDAPIPEGCQSLATNLENAIYGHATGRASFSQRNSAYRKFKSCLRAEGLSDVQIDSTVKRLEDRVQGYLKQDGAL